MLTKKNISVFMIGAIGARPNVIIIANWRNVNGRAVYMNVTWQLDVEGSSLGADGY